MKQFNLQEFIDNPSRKVVTRDGRSVRVICTDMKSTTYPVVALREDGSGYEQIFTFSKNGEYAVNESSRNDLFFAPEKHEGWVNLYKYANKDCAYYLGSINNSKAEAENKRDTSDKFIATIRIEWEE